MEKAEPLHANPDDKANVYHPSTFIHPKVTLVIPNSALEKGKNN